MKKKFTILFIFITSLSFAHPHVFINADITVCYNDYGISKLKMKYSFDKIFSNDLMQMFDKNKNKKLEASEIAQIKAKAFSNLVKYDYFVHIQKGDVKINTKNVSNFRAKVVNGIVSYYFDINTKIEIGILSEKIKIAVYDHTYFIEVVYNKGNPKFEDMGNFYYTHKIITDYKQAYYMNQIYPDCLILEVNKI